MVTRLETEYPRADRLDDARTLVAPHQGEQPGIGPVLGSSRCADVVGPQVLVGMAQTGGHPLDQDLEVPGRVEIDLESLPVLFPTPEHCCV